MHSESFLREASELALLIDHNQVERVAAALSNIDGRIFLIGLGGSLANCTHMAADLRKLCCMEAFAPDNVAELTAWANDAEWAQLFGGFLGDIEARDALFVLSVGGGTDQVSTPIGWAIGFAQGRCATIFGIVGPNGGETAKKGDHVIRIPKVNVRHITPHTEAFQAVIWHCLVSHPLLQKRPTKW